MLGLELEVEASGESVQLDLTLGEEPGGQQGGGLARGHGAGRGEDSLGQQSSQVSGLQHGLGGERLAWGLTQQRTRILTFWWVGSWGLTKGDSSGVSS